MRHSRYSEKLVERHLWKRNFRSPRVTAALIWLNQPQGVKRGKGNWLNQKLW